MRTTILDIQKLKDRGERIPMVTAYDYTSAQIADRAGIPMILVGDSLGMVVLGYDSTVHVTLDDMIHHIKAVVRGSRQALVIGDLPFLTYTTVDQAIQSAGRIMQECGAQAVKLEGGAEVAPIVQRLVNLGIPVMGHIGFTPQSVHQIGTRVQGKTSSGAARLIDDALALEEAGAFGLVLELIPAPLAREITAHLRIPTIGIGAGVHCSGQVQVWHDMLGLYSDFKPRHAKRYASLVEIVEAALQTYATEVREAIFPGIEHSARMEETELQAALSQSTAGKA
ncbi:MAG: 3-methyl-2-oxobutanoate hydroxymethyltransferase [Chloroflexia bacterium]|nr:3-methyl-2-oxobutanoate hydroxymethyltransferase [Chloroflexia bacterium]